MHRYALFGQGPVAFASALRCAALGQVTVHVAQDRPADNPLRIEVVPASTLSALLELGVRPEVVGVHDFPRHRVLAWESSRPRRVDVAPMALVERPALDNALRSLALKHPRVAICPYDYSTARQFAHEMRQSGVNIIDCTGRRAILAHRRFRLRKPWVARLFRVARPSRPRSVTFMSAATPDGYVYRADGPRFATIGVVGRGSGLTGGAGAVQSRLLASDVGWLVNELIDHEWVPAGAMVASVQWSEADIGIAAGDAALARDALSSQGLARGLRDSCYVPLCRSGEDADVFRRRSSLARAAHIETLLGLVRNVRCRRMPTWRNYEASLRKLGQAPLPAEETAWPTG